MGEETITKHATFGPRGTPIPDETGAPVVTSQSRPTDIDVDPSEPYRHLREISPLTAMTVRVIVPAISGVGDQSLYVFGQDVAFIYYCCRGGTDLR